MRRADAARGDAGMTLVELLISMVVFAMLMAMVTSLFITLTYQAKDNIAQTEAVQQARLGISQIDRQVRSGNLILDPALDGVDESGVAPNYSLRIYTQENGDYKCAQWRVIDHDGDGYAALEYRTWDPSYPLVPDVSIWHAVANNVIGPTASAADPDDPETWPPFWVDSSLPTGTEAQNIRISLRLLDPGARDDAKPVAVSTVVTGRNTVFGYSAASCSTVPAP
ncbi:PilW family protein [Demequina mangrovi]|uniref:Prepilin-type N-terminal cleavage/methylation domain-containing protein n=1 Tax=Demequina mangrovi TaxID=1043493 RepID=A0A1H6UA01_9MICO|nr:type II secretion system protein [Demequina mangrovi]SEI86457.1 prepilin-type N-terminal cleavage/methylation domain-containing protein [Demequina mangrovi]